MLKMLEPLPGVDRHDGERIDLLVPVSQGSPQAGLVQTERVGQLPRQRDVVQGVQGERHGLGRPLEYGESRSMAEVEIDFYEPKFD